MPDTPPPVPVMGFDLYTIPQFSGIEDDSALDDFTHALSAMVALKGLNADQTKQAVMLRTKGRARDFAAGIDGDTWKDVNALSKAFQKEFRPLVSKMSLERDLKNCKQHEGDDVLTFYHKLCRLMKKVREVTPKPPNISADVENHVWEERTKTHFLDGLRPEIFRAVNIQEPPTLAAARELAQRVELTEKSARTKEVEHSKSSIFSNFFSSPGAASTSDFEARIAALEAITSTPPPARTQWNQQRTPPRYSPKQARVSPGSIRCFLCFEIGHAVADCEFLICGKCRQPGHVPAKCPNPKN